MYEYNMNEVNLESVHVNNVNVKHCNYKTIKFNVSVEAPPDRHTLKSSNHEMKIYVDTYYTKTRYMTMDFEKISVQFFS